MDYRELLKKYIKNVGAEGGYTFIARHYDVFTAEEFTELEKLEAEVEDDSDHLDVLYQCPSCEAPTPGGELCPTCDEE